MGSAYTFLCPSLSCWWLSFALSPQLAEHDPTVMSEFGQSDRDVHGRLLETTAARQAKLRAFIEGNENSLKENTREARQNRSRRGGKRRKRGDFSTSENYFVIPNCHIGGPRRMVLKKGDFNSHVKRWTIGSDTGHRGVQNVQSAFLATALWIAQRMETAIDLGNAFHCPAFPAMLSQR